MAASNCALQERQMKRMGWTNVIRHLVPGRLSAYTRTDIMLPNGEILLDDVNDSSFFI
jgi:hypothetical protein